MPRSLRERTNELRIDDIEHRPDLTAPHGFDLRRMREGERWEMQLSDLLLQRHSAEQRFDSGFNSLVRPRSVFSDGIGRSGQEGGHE